MRLREIGHEWISGALDLEHDREYKEVPAIVSQFDRGKISQGWYAEYLGE